jgi:CRISPR-associated protein Csb1
VAVPEVRRARTYSLAGLRRLRFGGSADEDVAARAALLAMLLLGAAYADADPEIRAYCDVGAPVGQPELDGMPADLDLSIDACEQFLASAIVSLPDRLAWTGQTVELIGDPALDRGAVAADQPEA